jgi:leader peptidase (prepilin peptidase)/N-methyltransferase
VTGAEGAGVRWPLQSATIAAVAAVAVVASLAASPDLQGVLGAGLALTMLAIAVIDGRSFTIPDELSAVALVLALMHAALQDPAARIEAVAWSLVRAAALAACFLAVRAAYHRWRGREGLGLGDVKLAGVAGAWLGWDMMPVAVEIAAVVALAVYALNQLVDGAPIRATGRLPFGLFLAPAIWLCWLLETVLDL